MKWYSDFIFWNYDKNQILEIESLQEGDEMAHAQKLAQEHRCTVAYAVVAEYSVKPMKCPVCQDIAPADGRCPCSEFKEEIDAKPETLPAHRGRA